MNIDASVAGSRLDGNVAAVEERVRAALAAEVDMGLPLPCNVIV